MPLSSAYCRSLAARVRLGELDAYGQSWLNVRYVRQLPFQSWTVYGMEAPNYTVFFYVLGVYVGQAWNTYMHGWDRIHWEDGSLIPDTAVSRLGTSWKDDVLAYLEKE